jgi:hypothetical protein
VLCPLITPLGDDQARQINMIEGCKARFPADRRYPEQETSGGPHIKMTLLSDSPWLAPRFLKPDRGRINRGRKPGSLKKRSPVRLPSVLSSYSVRFHSLIYQPNCAIITCRRQSSSWLSGRKVTATTQSESLHLGKHAFGA